MYFHLFIIIEEINEIEFPLTSCFRRICTFYRSEMPRNIFLQNFCLSVCLFSLYHRKVHEVKQNWIKFIHIFFFMASRFQLKMRYLYRKRLSNSDFSATYLSLSLENVRSGVLNWTNLFLCNTWLWWSGPSWNWRYSPGRGALIANFRRFFFVSSESVWSYVWNLNKNYIHVFECVIHFQVKNGDNPFQGSAMLAIFVRWPQFFVSCVCSCSKKRLMTR